MKKSKRIETPILLWLARLVLVAVKAYVCKVIHLAYCSSLRGYLVALAIVFLIAGKWVPLALYGMLSVLAQLTLAAMELAYGSEVENSIVEYLQSHAMSGWYSAAMYAEAPGRLEIVDLFMFAETAPHLMSLWVLLIVSALLLFTMHFEIVRKGLGVLLAGLLFLGVAEVALILYCGRCWLPDNPLQIWVDYLRLTRFPGDYQGVIYPQIAMLVFFWSQLLAAPGECLRWRQRKRKAESPPDSTIIRSKADNAGD